MKCAKLIERYPRLRIKWLEIIMPWLVQGVPRLSPNDNWDRLQPPHNPKLDQAGIENGWMDDHAMST